MAATMKAFLRQVQDINTGSGVRAALANCVSRQSEHIQDQHTWDSVLQAAFQKLVDLQLTPDEIYEELVDWADNEPHIITREELNFLVNQAGYTRDVPSREGSPADAARDAMDIGTSGGSEPHRQTSMLRSEGPLASWGSELSDPALARGASSSLPISRFAPDSTTDSPFQAANAGAEASPARWGSAISGAGAALPDGTPGRWGSAISEGPTGLRLDLSRRSWGSYTSESLPPRSDSPYRGRSNLADLHPGDMSPREFVAILQAEENCSPGPSPRPGEHAPDRPRPAAAARLDRNRVWGSFTSEGGSSTPSAIARAAAEGRRGGGTEPSPLRHASSHPNASAAPTPPVSPPPPPTALAVQGLAARAAEAAQARVRAGVAAEETGDTVAGGQAGGQVRDADVPAGVAAPLPARLGLGVPAVATGWPAVRNVGDADAGPVDQGDGARRGGGMAAEEAEEVEAAAALPAVGVAAAVMPPVRGAARSLDFGAAKEYDAVVIGAGFAGLTCARTLVAEGLSVLVLEARHRVGGRVHTVSTRAGPGADAATTYMDMGGAMVGPGQDAVLQLLDELGIKTVQLKTPGKTVMHWRGRKRTYEGLIPPLPIYASLELALALWRLDSIARSIDLEAPWSSPRAEVLDGVTMDAWVRSNCWSADARQLLRMALVGINAASPPRTSVLYMGWIARGAGSWDNLLEGAQENCIEGGAGAAAARVAEGLGERVRLGHAVSSIRQLDAAAASGAAGNVLVSGDGFSVRARKVVVAVPPPCAARISFSPPLPPARDQLLQHMPMGAAVKLGLVYLTPFWRQRGLSGVVISDVGPVSFLADVTPPRGAAGVLAAFVLADAALTWGALSPAQRRDAVITLVVDTLGEEGRQPLHYEEVDWAAEAWSLGAYGGVPTPGTVSGPLFRQRAVPVGHVHWAGTETADAWNGYMDGAVSSGRRAAAEVLAALNAAHT